ncbi:carbohydrate ABC transporter permease [Dictyobacter kobayashii]|uniref:Sugar ABC transporter ATP-binding protein n=1 Tax=Dictyobacter kobayashii TaxID=2014872 RepID=A0A402AF52_9CHLR|nr:carbohydrate ABC transporter permease [Dictyobacter kobayashii]GCE17731.1 sugar ABC transporter ATP-binding protein [Dictyobacter kobayashii]
MADVNLATSEVRQRSEARTRRNNSYKTRFYIGSTIVNAILLILLVLTVIPFIYMISSAFKPNSEIFGTPLTLIPVHFTLVNMQALLTNFPFARWAFNTATVAVLGTITSLVLGSLAGFAFAKYDFPFKNALFAILLATMLIPGQVTLVPQFEVIRFLHWFNTYQALILPRAVSAFTIFLMRQYTLSVPDELLDAARVDGATEFSIWWRVVVPLVRPGLAVVAILSFTGLWNDYLWPLVVTTDPNMFVMNLGISSLVGPYDYQYGILLSGAVLAALPLIIIFFIFQKQFLQGLTEGALK